MVERRQSAHPIATLQGGEIRRVQLRGSDEKRVEKGLVLVQFRRAIESGSSGGIGLHQSSRGVDDHKRRFAKIEGLVLSPQHLLTFFLETQIATNRHHAQLVVYLEAVRGELDAALATFLVAQRDFISPQATLPF